MSIDNFPWEAAERLSAACMDAEDGKAVVDPADVNVVLGATSLVIPEWGASELRIMAYLDHIVAGLEPDERRRSLAWLGDRYPQDTPQENQ